MSLLLAVKGAVWLRRGGARDVARIYHDAVDYLEGLADTPTLEQYAEAADYAEVPPAAIQSLWQIESAQRARVDGVEIKRIEPHIWRRYGGDRRDLPKPLNPKSQTQRHDNFKLLRAVDAKRAILCSSFGGSQIMGFNAECCGFVDEETFYRAQQSGAAAQLRAQARFISHRKNRRLQRALQTGDADLVGYHWNGPRYQENRYAEKYEACLRRFSA